MWPAQTAAGVTFTVAAPAATTVEVVGLALVEDTGTIGDGVTQRPAIRGRVQSSGSVAGLRVEADLDGDGAADLAAVTAGDGSFTVSPAGLAAGPVTARLRARQWDYAERRYVWSDWAALAFTLEAREPAPAVVDLALQSDTGASATDRVTANPLVVGRVAGAGGGLLVEIDADQDGSPDVVSGRCDPASDGRLKTSHFEDKPIGQVAFWDHPVPQEVRHAQSAPSGHDRDDPFSPSTRLVAAAYRP